jgi:hypothetical protein
VNGNLGLAGWAVVGVILIGFAALAVTSERRAERRAERRRRAGAPLSRAEEKALEGIIAASVQRDGSEETTP